MAPAAAAFHKYHVSYISWGFCEEFGNVLAPNDLEWQQKAILEKNDFLLNHLPSLKQYSGD